MSTPAIPQPAALAENVDSAPPTRVRYRVMAFLCVLAFITYFDRVCIMRAQVAIQQDLNLADWQLSYVLGAFFLAYGLFEIPGGWMCGRFGPRSTLIRIVIAWSFFTALSGCATGFLSLLFIRFLFGAGEAGAFPTMGAIQSQWVPSHQRARFGGILWLFARWGGAFSPIIFGAMLHAFDSTTFRSTLASIPGLSSLQDVASWRFGFWAAGLLGVFWVLAFYPWFRSNPAEMPSVNKAELALLKQGNAPHKDDHSINKKVWRALWSSRSLWALAGLYFCGSFAWSFFISWLPRYLKDSHGVAFENSELMSGLPLLVGGCACLLGGLLSDWLVRRTGRKRFSRAILPVCGCVIAAISIFAVRGVDNAWQATILICLAAAAYDFGQSANWASIVDIGGRNAGLAIGLVNMIGNFASFIQPRVGAYLFQNHGWDVLLTVYAAIFLLAGSMWLWIDPTKAFDSDTHSPEPAIEEKRKIN